jgi:hypothetical protein
VLIGARRAGLLVHDVKSTLSNGFFSSVY